MPSGLQSNQPARAGAGDQQQVIAFLSDGKSYGEASAVVERIETHISIVFLVGQYAYKLKRAVRFSYLDYSHPGFRERYCKAELELNRRTAPDIYLRVRVITLKPDGSLRFDGAGIAVEWVLEMRRFDQDDLFDRLAMAGKLTPGIMRDLADRVAAFHNTAAIVMTQGGQAGIQEAIAGNNINLTKSCPPLSRARVDYVNAKVLAELTMLGPLLERRRQEGKVRRCHGDLHLRNICLFSGQPMVFDGIEFNDAFSCIDVFYDLAFLLMDLLHRGFPELASLVFNRYLDRTSDICGLSPLKLFMSVRASIRAHVLVAQNQNDHSPRLVEEAQSYLSLAEKFLGAQKPCLIAIGGLSGTGKSTISAALAPTFSPAPGARVIRSDVVRKTLSGVAPETRLPASAYRREVTERVYAELYGQARQTLAAGYTAIVDATFLSDKDRREVEAIARSAGIKFAGFWLEAPRNILEQRLKLRHNDASDADTNILGRQEVVDVGTVDWTRIDASEANEIQLAFIRQSCGA